MIRFLPSETVYKRSSFHKTLKPGPGVDYGGQMPIPQESMMKRLASVKVEKTKKKINLFLKKGKEIKATKHVKIPENKNTENGKDAK